jgi:hypothetical protein
VQLLRNEQGNLLQLLFEEPTMVIRILAAERGSLREEMLRCPNVNPKQSAMHLQLIHGKALLRLRQAFWFADAIRWLVI